LDQNYYKDYIGYIKVLNRFKGNGNYSEATISMVQDRILGEIFHHLHQQREADYWKEYGELLDNDVRIGHDLPAN
jgi:hypothetical protein